MAKSIEKLEMKLKRIDNTNVLLLTISQLGKKFFSCNKKIPRFELDKRNRLWFIDKNGGRVYTHHRGKWKEFSYGGILRAFIEALCGYIKTGKEINNCHLGPWEICNDDLWAYGNDMKIVRKQAKQFGIIKPKQKQEIKRGIEYGQKIVITFQTKEEEKHFTKQFPEADVLEIVTSTPTNRLMFLIDQGAYPQLYDYVDKNYNSERKHFGTKTKVH